MKGQVRPAKKNKISTMAEDGLYIHTGLPVQGSRLLELTQYICCVYDVGFKTAELSIWVLTTPWVGCQAFFLLLAFQHLLSNL